MLPLESPPRGDSNEYTQYTIFNMKKKKKKNHLKLSQICSCGILSKGLKNEFETAVVNEPSVFEPLKFCCISVNVSLENIYKRYFLELLFLVWLFA